jgi:ATP-binding cassette subfamily C protein
MAAEAARLERERLDEKAAAGRGAFRGAMCRLAGTLETGAPAARVRMRAAEEAGPGEDDLLAACRLVGAAMDLPVTPYPHEKGAALPRDPLAAVARASRFRTRQVVLHEGWWREDGGPLLAWMADDERPVALVPAPGARYTLHDPRNRVEVPVDAATADGVKPLAFSFYRPFADQKLSLMDVVRFGLRGCGRDLAMVGGLSAAAALLSLVTPIATGMIFNDVIPGAERGQLGQITLALLVIAVATFLFRLATGVALARIEGRMGGSTQAAVWDRVLGLPMPFFRPYSAGNLASRAMGIDAIRQQLSGATISALLSGLFSLVHFGLLYSYSPRLAVWGTGLIAVAIAVAAAASRVQRASEHEIAALRGRLSGSVLQFLSSIAKLRSAAAEGQAFSIWARGFSEQRRLQFRARSVQNLVNSFNAGYPVVTTLVLYAVALPLMSDPENPLRTGDFMAFMASFGTCLAGMLGASTALLGALSVIPLYEQARPILETLPEVDTAKADPGVLTGGIDIERVTFRYNPEGAPILRDLTMRIQPGEFVAFVGPSGSGKSTLLRLLLGFETPESGGVYYDGRELAGLDAQAVRRQIGVVLQNGRLMSGDIFTNIMGSTPGTQEDAWEAARMAGFDEDVRGMPMGMHTVVSEGGGTLSGGQRQRLMIARAIVQRPRILFFDEATSALDNRTQAIVTESLDRLSATRIVIAHRLSTVLHADRIFVIEAGRIVQTGSYDELIAQEGLFAELAKRQMA